MPGIASIDYVNSLVPTNSTGTGFSTEGGLYITLINNTGATSVKGSVVRASTSIDNACSLTPAGSDEPIGVILESGVANGSPVKVVVSGKAYCLIQNGLAATRGYWVGISNSVGGRVDFAVDPPSTVVHWEEVGHCLETVTSGTDKLALCVLHFN